MKDLTPSENNLLLYLETCSVDYGGKIDRRRINDAELKTLEQWSGDGFIQFGRIAAHDIVGGLSLWAIPSDDAWNAAHRERRARHERMMQNRRAEYIGLRSTNERGESTLSDDADGYYAARAAGIE